ncbi:hypothetical protein MKW98_010336, partial [Papaver atlanticum]
EQHLVCNLHFSWPQVSRDTVCPPRGSGAVFASYRDCDSQMQKFAMRFKVASDAQAFMDFIRVQPSPPAFIEQEGSTDKNEIGNSETDLWPEISSSYEFDFPDGPCYRVEELETAFMRTLKQHNWRLGTTVTEETFFHKIQTVGRCALAFAGDSGVELKRRKDARNEVIPPSSVIAGFYDFDRGANFFTSMRRTSRGEG